MSNLEVAYAALPAGYRNNNGNFNNLGNNAYFWSSMEGSISNAYFQYLGYSTAEIFRNYDSKLVGFSVVCVRDWLFVYLTILYRQNSIKQL